MKFIKIITMFSGLLSLFGCSGSNYDVIDPRVSSSFVRHSKTGEVFFRTIPGGSFLPIYHKTPTNHPKKFKPLSGLYATDSEQAFYQSNVIIDASAKHFKVHKNFSNTFAYNSKNEIVYFQDKTLPKP